MAGGQQAENTLHENAVGWMIMGVILMILVWLFWKYQAPIVREGISWIRLSEMWVISWFIQLGNMAGIWGDEGYTVIYKGSAISWMEWYDKVREWPKDRLNYDHLTLLNALAMQPLRLVFFIITMLGALWCIFKGPLTHYRSSLGLEGFIHRQAHNFPVIAPFVDFNPGTQAPRPPGSPVPAELPSFAEALGPEEWLAYTNNTAPDGSIDEAVARKAFTRQLGGRWKGPMALKPYQQVLLAAFCLKAARKRDLADIMLGRMALCWSFKGGLRLNRDRKLINEARKVLKNKDLAGETLAKCNQHAFVTTALLRGLITAREEGGVMAPAAFVWLRGYDRTLWYPLNNLGRQSYHMEAIGAISHFKAERLTQRPIPIPKVDFAIQTLSAYMKSRKARPIPQLDYSQSSKRGVKKAL